MIVKLLTEHHLEFLSLKGGCRGSSKFVLVKMSNCWKYHAVAHIAYMCIPSQILCNCYYAFNFVNILENVTL